MLDLLSMTTGKEPATRWPVAEAACPSALRSDPETLSDAELAAQPVRRVDHRKGEEHTERERAIIVERLRRTAEELQRDWTARGFPAGGRVRVSENYRTLHPDRQRWPGRVGTVIRPNGSDGVYVRLDPMPRERVEKTALFGADDLVALPAGFLPVVTTPGTRIRWRTVGEWLDCGSEILARRCTTKRYTDAANHLEALTKERIDAEDDPIALDRLIGFLERPRGAGMFNQPPRGQRQGDRATDLLVWAHNRLVGLERQRARAAGAEAVPAGPVIVRPADASDVAGREPGAFVGRAPQDRITIRLRGDYEEEGRGYGDTISGSYLTQAGMHFLVFAPEGAGGLDSRVLGPFDPDDVASVTVVQTAVDVVQERRDRARGEPFLTRQPADRDGFERALYELGAEIARLRDVGDDARDAGDVTVGQASFRRALQLRAQFDELADLIALARSKRRFVLADAGMRLRHGRSFEPSRDCDGPLAAQQFERPLALDYSPDPAVRKGRAARKAERYGADPVAEELDLMRSRLRQRGVEARRPRHTNHLLIKIDTSAGPALWNYGLGPDGKTPTVTWGESGKAGRAAVTRKRRSETTDPVRIMRCLAAERLRELQAAERSWPLRLGDEFDHRWKRWRLTMVKPDGTVRAAAVDKGSLLMHDTVWVRIEDFERGTGRRLAPELLAASDTAGDLAQRVADMPSPPPSTGDEAAPATGRDTDAEALQPATAPAGISSRADPERRRAGRNDHRHHRHHQVRRRRAPELRNAARRPRADWPRANPQRVNEPPSWPGSRAGGGMSSAPGGWMHRASRAPPWSCVAFSEGAFGSPTPGGSSGPNWSGVNCRGR